MGGAYPALAGDQPTWPITFTLNNLVNASGEYAANVTQDINFNCLWPDIFNGVCDPIPMTFDVWAVNAYTSGLPQRLMCIIPNALAIAFGVVTNVYNLIRGQTLQRWEFVQSIVSAILLLVPVIDLVLTYAIPDSQARDIAVTAIGSACLAYFCGVFGYTVFKGSCERILVENPYWSDVIQTPVTITQIEAGVEMTGGHFKSSPVEGPGNEKSEGGSADGAEVEYVVYED
jgi:hypothetical protein